MSRRRIVAAILGALALAAVLIGAAFVLASSGGPNGELASYYFVARVQVIQDEAEFGNDEPLDTVRGWYESPGRWRWEFSASDLARVEEGSIQVSDGETVWFYDRPTNTYYRQTLTDYNHGRPPELANGPPLFVGGFLIGWLPYGDEERFFQGWDEREEADGGEVAGRETRLFVVTRGETTTRFWIDTALPFVLKFEAEAPGTLQSVVRAEIVEISINEGIDEGSFTFEPADEALEVEAPGRQVSGSSGSTTLGSNIVDAPEGFLSPVYVPEGYVSVRSGGTSSSTLDGRQTRFTVRLEDDDTRGYLEIDEQYRAGGLAESHRTGQPLPVGRGGGYDQSDGDLARLTWAQGDIVVTLTSDVLPLGELLRAAESMR